MSTGNNYLAAAARDKTRQPSRLLIKAALAVLAVAGLATATIALAGSAPLPGHSHAFGKTLAEWQDTYFRWFLGDLSIPPDKNGNAVVGHIVLMPLPNVPGDGTPGHLDVTLHSGQGFVLPLFYLLGTSYTDGTPPDPLVDPSFFQTLNLTLQIDGKTVVTESNLKHYFSQFYFQPPIPINSPPIDSVIWCEDAAIVHPPLPPGMHTIKVDLKSTQPLPPNFGGGFPEYHNTWTVTVKPGK
jgi:hypothetical protein